MIEITKPCTAACLKTKNSLAVRCSEKHVNLKKTEDSENFLFKALANRLWLTSKRCSWFNKVVHGQPSIKLTS